MGSAAAVDRYGRYGRGNGTDDLVPKTVHSLRILFELSCCSIACGGESGDLGKGLGARPPAILLPAADDIWF